VPHRLADRWMHAGAVGWYVFDASGQPDCSHSAPWCVSGESPASAPIRRLPPMTSWPYLTHWTRQCYGPWPDEDASDYLDDLILDRDGADHSAFAALWRIVQTRRLIATGQLVRGEQEVVCFTEVPLAEMPDRRSYRSHLARWDFEPYGVCILRDWLQQAGARPVQYGDEEDWLQLPENERPFFQKRLSHCPSGEVIDWTIEREWRHPGDVDLSTLAADEALVFVPTMTEARQLAAISPWPVMLLQS
jgi:hypothetical protein